MMGFDCRNDSFESSLTTLLQLGTSVFNIAMTALGSAPQSSLFASKVGVADGLDPGLDSLSPEQMLHRQQVRQLQSNLLQFCNIWRSLVTGQRRGQYQCETKTLDTGSALNHA